MRWTEQGRSERGFREIKWNEEEGISDREQSITYARVGVNIRPQFESHVRMYACI